MTENNHYLFYEFHVVCRSQSKVLLTVKSNYESNIDFALTNHLHGNWLYGQLWATYIQNPQQGTDCLSKICENVKWLDTDFKMKITITIPTFWISEIICSNTEEKECFVSKEYTY